MAYIMGRCSLVFYGENLPINEIEKNLKLIPNKVIKKGDIFKNRESSELDVCIFELKMNNGEVPEKLVERLLRSAEHAKEYIKEISTKYRITLSVFSQIDIKSQMLELYYAMSPSVIKLLSELNIGLDLSYKIWQNY